MRIRSKTVIGSLLVATALSFAAAALAQELQLDPKALDTSAAGTAKARKAGKAQAAKQPAGKTQGGKAQGGKTPDRQFGELEGWSPGKAPPGKKEDETTSPSKSGPSISTSPSGNMSVGVPF